MKDISFSTITEIRNDILKKEYTSADVVDFYSKRFAKIDDKIKSALEIFDKESILKKVASQNGALYGVPGLIKDNICQTDRVASCASKILQNFKAPYDATVIERLKNSGALLLGRANMDEFAMGSSTETSAFFKTRNPWNLDCVPGGSSGGSAAAVAAGLVPWALGSDTGGSVRQPAGFCNVVGLKPTYGAISRYGLIAYASSLDQIGVFSRTVYDNAIVYSEIAGHDSKDASSLRLQKKDYTQELEAFSPKGLRIGIVKTAFEAEGLDTEVAALTNQAVITMQKQGAVVKEIALPTLDYAAATYFIISRAEAASNLARFDGVRYGLRAAEIKNVEDLYIKSRSQGFGKEVQSRMMVGNYVLSAGYAGKFYHNAQKVQRLIRKDFNDAFAQVDVLMMPTQSCPAFKLGAFDHNKLQMDLQDYFTAPVNLAGIAALSVPCGFTKERMPVGVQFIGPKLSEQLLFKVGHAYQQITDWHLQYPSFR
ncbi:Asp-tRNA(Asn)/Glu-tRNA(Gln) amidotransferase subunit GatA [Candidatus Dependentiae bacterium]|nr:Asp-tRNA(Asn)/Glu-tRNA(Gln) amidotransferase subunit GatA [Candidatus Dependentiae bacterium]